MRPESSVPVRERVLVLEGRASPKVCRTLPAPFRERRADRVAFFSSFAYADLPLGTRFDVVFRLADPTRVQDVACELVAVTQQYSVLAERIDYGWKTICLFEFSGQVPVLVSTLPHVAAWYAAAASDRLGLASRDAWELIAERA